MGGGCVFPSVLTQGGRSGLLFFRERTETGHTHCSAPCCLNLGGLSLLLMLFLWCLGGDPGTRTCHASTKLHPQPS
jgi:hypothetical protein